MKHFDFIITDHDSIVSIYEIKDNDTLKLKAVCGEKVDKVITYANEILSEAANETNSSR